MAPPKLGPIGSATQGCATPMPIAGLRLILSYLFRATERRELVLVGREGQEGLSTSIVRYIFEVGREAPALDRGNRETGVWSMGTSVTT